MQMRAKPEPAFGAFSINHPERFLVFAAAGLTVTLFALTPSTTRLAVAQLDGLSIGVIRTIGAGLAAIPLLVIFRLPPPSKWKDWRLLIVSALGSFAAFPVLFSLGQQRTSGTHAALIMAVMPLLVGFIGMALERRVPRTGWFFGAAIALAGEAGLVSLQDGASAGTASVTGDAIVLSGCIMFAIGVVAGARLCTRVNPWGATFWAIAVASLVLTPLAILHAGNWPSSIRPATWIALIHVTLGATILANVAWLWALARGGIVRIAPLQFSQPILAVLFASVFLREHLNFALASVAGIIVFGIVIACRGAGSPLKERVRITARSTGFGPQACHWHGSPAKVGC